MDDLDLEARALLQEARASRTPSAADRARIEGRLALALGSAAVASAAATASAGSAVGAGAAVGGSAAVGGAKAAWISLLAKGVGVAIALGALGTGAVVVTRSATSSPPIATVAVPERSESPAREELAELQEPRALEEAAPTTVPVDKVEEVDGLLEEHASVRSRKHAPNRDHAPADLAAELELLHAAQRAWRQGDGARALTLVAEHERRYTRTQLGPERTALRILALCDLGRTSEARRIADHFLRVASQSPSRRSVEDSCAAR